MLDKTGIYVKIQAQAEVAELADALRSGRSEGSLLRVQIPPSAHKDPSAGLLFYHDRLTAEFAENTERIFSLRASRTLR